MLKPALRIAAVLAALLSPSLAPAQSYELAHRRAGEQVRPICFGRAATVLFLEALHFQMSVLGRNYSDGVDAISTRTAGRGDINCYYLRSTAVLERPPDIVDVVELNGLGPWPEFALYGAASSSVTHKDGTVYTRHNMGDVIYTVVTDLFVRKRP